MLYHYYITIAATITNILSILILIGTTTGMSRITLSLRLLLTAMLLLSSMTMNTMAACPDGETCLTDQTCTQESDNTKCQVRKEDRLIIKINYICIMYTNKVERDIYICI